MHCHTYIQWNPLSMKLKRLMKMYILSEFCVITIARDTRGIEGAICCFCVIANFVLSDLVLTGFHCMYLRTLSCFAVMV